MVLFFTLLQSTDNIVNSMYMFYYNLEIYNLTHTMEFIKNINPTFFIIAPNII